MRKSKGHHRCPDFSSDEEETLKPVEKGHVVIIDHIVPSSADLSAFEWGRYERGLAKLAGVDQEKVFVSAEPGRTALELHATLAERPGAAAVAECRNATDGASCAPHG